MKSSVDWVSAGAVTAVQDQGGCGSCWAFSAVGAIEGAYFIKNRNLKEFSVQELVSCDTSDSGCDGGWMDSAFDWVRSNNGVALASQYPYTSGDQGETGSCSSTASFPGTSLSTFINVASNVQQVQVAVKQQPLSVAIDADDDVFQFYAGGVITSGCGQSIDHGVLLVGYGKLDGVAYWKVSSFPLYIFVSFLTLSSNRLKIPGVVAGELMVMC